MLKFIFRILGFLLIPIAAIASMEFYISLHQSNFFTEDNLEKQISNIGNRYDWINEVKKDKKVFLLGASSVKYGLSCSKLNQLSKDSLAFINLANDARDPIEVYFILKQIDLSGCKAAYLGIDTWILARSYYRYRIPYMYLDLSFFKAFSYSIEHDNTLFIKRYKSLFSYLFPSKLPIEDNNKTIPPDFGSVKLARKAKNFNEPINEWYQIEKYGWSEIQFIYMKKIDSLCKAKNIQLSVFIPPKRSDFSMIYRTKCTSIHQEFVDKLVKLKFTPFIFGSFNQLDTIGDSKLFQEAYHLNENGQSIYTSIFYEMIQKQNPIFSHHNSWFN